MTHDDSHSAGPYVDPLNPSRAGSEGTYLDSNGEFRPLDGDRAIEAPAAKPVKRSSATREIVETLLLALVIFVAVRALVLNFKVDGRSMIPNLQNNEMLLVN